MLMLVDDIELLTEQIERLIIENGLLRVASEEQRKLNGIFRSMTKKAKCKLDINGSSLNICFLSLSIKDN